MRIRFIDAGENAKRYNVGDYFNNDDNYSCDEKIREEFWLFDKYMLWGWVS